MKARNALASLVLVAVGLLLALSEEAVSPGALARVHARGAPDSPQACADCHAGAGSSLAAACARCHADVAASLAARRGLHGQLDAALAQDCARCHVEHQGAHVALGGEHAFALAGVASVADFRHEGLDFALTGEHAALRCERCHAQALADPLPAGQQRFLGLSQNCSSCHADVHHGSYGADCAACHGQTGDFEALGGLAHEDCPLVGAHRELDCQSCHRDGSGHAVSALLARRGAATPVKATETRDCLACHVSPHRDGFVQGVAQRGAGPAGSVPGSAGMSCRECHSAAQHSFIGETPAAPEGWHAASGFALDAPHDGLRCESCHARIGQRARLQATVAEDAPRPAPDLRAFREDFPGRAPDDCQACHAQPHGAQFADGPFAAARCVDCHAQQAFSPAHFDAAEHARSGFALQGAHATAACAQCHRLPAGAPDTPAGRAQRRFAGVPTACSACHASPHAEAFLAGVAERTGLPDAAATCAQCHAASDAGFTAPRAEGLRALHAAAGLSLEAPHGEVDCADCHAGIGTRKLDAGQITPPAQLAALADGAMPLPVAHADSTAFRDAFPGRLADDCSSCHVDAHRGQFESGPFAGQGCLACHARQGFTPPDFDEEHHARTSFPLTGAHLGVGCNACHARGADAAAGAPRAFAGTPSACGACHADAHAGAFDAPALPTAVDGATSCARCHGTAAWDDAGGARFDHALWTGFALDGAHARADCAACHATRAQPDENGRRFGHAAGRACSDCHAAGTPREDGR